MPATTEQATIYQQIWAGEIPSYPIYRYDEGDGQGLMAILDICPATLGHVLIIPEEPVQQWTDLAPERLRQISRLGQLVAQRQIDVLPGVNRVVQSFFGDDVPHVHSHNIPSYDRGDVVRRMQPDSGRTGRRAGSDELSIVQKALQFPDELREYADMEMSTLGERSSFLYFLKRCLFYSSRRRYERSQPHARRR